jgi:hypothetical protein
MDQSQFTELSFAEKADTVLAHGKPIASRQYYNQDIILFLVYGFFVEVWYNDNQKDIEEIKEVEKTKVLSLYTKDIDLSGLGL